MPGWRHAAYGAVRPVLFTADPERVHGLVLGALGLAGRSPAGRALCRLASGVDEPAAAPVEVAGLRFRNRIGLGAGFDKDGVADKFFWYWLFQGLSFRSSIYGFQHIPNLQWSPLSEPGLSSGYAGAHTQVFNQA